MTRSTSYTDATDGSRSLDSGHHQYCLLALLDWPVRAKRKGIDTPTCPLCGSEMTIKTGSLGKFYSCIKYLKRRGSLNLVLTSPFLHFIIKCGYDLRICESIFQSEIPTDEEMLTL